MEYPARTASCLILKSKESSSYDIECSIEGTSTCVIDPSNTEITVGNTQPDPIQIDEQHILYISSITGQNSYIYKINVGPMIFLF